METQSRILRPLITGTVLALAVIWSLASAGPGRATGAYPRADLLASPEWLESHARDPDVVIVDVRTDEHFDGKLIPGATRLPWSLFRRNAPASNVGSLFVGVARAQEILGEHGIGRTDTLVLYDSVERDGGATASYVFWVLDVLGHEDKRVLEGGMDAWQRAGYVLDATPRKRRAILYQAPMDELREDRLTEGPFVYQRLGDPLYRIVDVRSEAEYLGRKTSRDLRGNPLKRGHIPTAVNIDYERNWVDAETKRIRPYEELRTLYRGLDPGRGVIVYCNSGRRSSFSYFVLRLMGFDTVYTYEASWKEWGNPDRFYPVETRKRELAGAKPSRQTGARGKGDQEPVQQTQDSPKPDEPTRGGYVSCGG